MTGSDEMQFYKSKLVVSFVLISLIVSLFTPIILANTFTVDTDASQYIKVRLNEMDLAYSKAIKSKTNIIELLKIYAQYIIILDFVDNTAKSDSNTLLLTDDEYKQFKNNVNAMTAEINTIYGTQGISIENKTVDFQLTETINRTLIENIFTDFIKQMIDVIVANSLSNLTTNDTETSLLNEENINKVINNSRKDIVPLAGLYNTIIRETTFWNMVTVNGYKNNIFNTNIFNLSENIKKLMDKALSYYTEDGLTIEEITLKETDSILSMLTNTKMQNGKLNIDGDSANLSELGYLLIAAGVVYDPFVSRAGNDLYLSSIKEFITSEQQWIQVTTIIKKACSLKKPLWVTTTNMSNNKSINDTSSYRPAFLTDLISINDTSTVGTDLYKFGILKGTMKPSSIDGDTYEYIQGNIENTITNIQDGNISSNNSTDSLANGILTVGSKTILAGSQEITEPLLYITDNQYSLLWETLIGNTTNIILHNAQLDTKSNSSLLNEKTGLLFVNGLGDIVLSDDTIILPAISNPILYSYDSPRFKLDENSTPAGYFSRNGKEFTVDNVTINGYYPYSATFMNHSPEARVAGVNRNKLSLANKKDVSKFIIVGALGINSKVDEGLCNFGVEVLKGNANTGQISGKTRAVVPIDIKSFSVTEKIEDTATFFRIFELGQDLGLRFIYDIGSAINNSDNAYYALEMLYNSEQTPFFPLIEDGEDINQKVKISAPLITSAKRYISKTSNNNELEPSGRFNIDYLIKNFISEALIGTQYADSIVKNSQVSYEEFVADTSNRFTKFIIDIVKKIIEAMGNIDGVLGMRNAYENSFFAFVVQFISNYYLFIALGLILIIAVKFLKNHLSVPYILLLVSLTISGFEIYTTWLPTYVPGLYNFFVNDITEQIAWNTVFHTSEDYSETYANSDRVTASGEPKPYTSTITLYQLSTLDIDNASTRLGVRKSDILGGKIIFLDQEAGIFLHGNLIKMSIDKALANKTVRGLYKTQWDLLSQNQNIDLPNIETTNINKNPYQIRFVNRIVSLDSYYTPYNEIIESFISNLNTMSSIFKIQRNTFSYDKEFYKDAFMVNSFLNSGIFLDPENINSILSNIIDGSIDGGNYTITSVQELIKNKFPYPKDWLNLNSFLIKPSESLKDTLWMKTLQKNNYYDEKWNPTAELGDLIAYINQQTKLFIMQNQEQVNFVSDENAIKLISLYATTAMTHRASRYTSWLYPNYINSPEIELKDVLYGAMTSIYDRNLAIDGEIVSTIDYIYGLFGVILIALIVIFSSIFILVITYLIPLLYALLGLMIIIKMIASDEATPTIRGYAKITFITLLLYFFYNLSLTLTSNLGHNWFALLQLAIVSFLCCWFLSFVLISLLSNLSDLGNATLKSNLLKATNILTHGAVGKLAATIGNMTSKAKTGVMNAGNSIVNMYGRNMSIDNLPISQTYKEFSLNDMEMSHPKYSPHRRKK